MKPARNRITRLITSAYLAGILGLNGCGRDEGTAREARLPRPTRDSAKSDPEPEAVATPEIPFSTTSVANDNLAGLPPPPDNQGSGTDGALLKRLTAHHIPTHDIVHVASIDEILRWAAPGRTLVLAPGTYIIPKEGLGKAVSSPGLSLVGTGVTRLIQPDINTSVLSLQRTDNVTLYGLTLGHKDGACAGGVLDIAYSKGVRVIQCELFGCGTFGLDLLHADNFALVDSRVFDCSDGLADITDSTGVRWERSRLEDNGPELYRGIRLTRAQLELVDVEVRNNGAEPGITLFEFDVDAIESPIGYKPDPRPIRANVTMRRGAIEGNGFTHLTNDPTKLTLEGVELAPGRFETEAYENTPQFWCTCARTLASRSSPITLCLETQEACDGHVRALERGELTGLLASSLLHDCEPAYGTTPALALRDEGTWKYRDKVWHRAGICLPEPPTTVTTTSTYQHAEKAASAPSAALRSVASLAPAIEWNSLLPLFDASVGKTGHPTILIGIQSEDIYETILRDDSETQRWHPVTELGTPKEVRTHKTPFVVSAKGPESFTSVKEWALSDQGVQAYWQVKFNGPMLKGRVVATTGAPHSNARILGLKTTILSDTVQKQVLREVARLVGKRWQHPLLTALPESKVSMTVLEGVSVGGATHWVSINVDLPVSEDFWGVVVTVDSHGHIIQTVTQPVGNIYEFEYRTEGAAGAGYAENA